MRTDEISTAISNGETIEITTQDGKIHIAPLGIGYNGKNINVLAIYLDGYSLSKSLGKAKSDFRMYTLDNIIDAFPTGMYQKLKSEFTREYIERSFDKTIITIHS